MKIWASAVDLSWFSGVERLCGKSSRPQTSPVAEIYDALTLSKHQTHDNSDDIPYSRQLRLTVFCDQTTSYSYCSARGLLRARFASVSQTIRSALTHTTYRCSSTPQTTHTSLKSTVRLGTRPKEYVLECCVYSTWGGTNEIVRRIAWLRMMMMNYTFVYLTWAGTSGITWLRRRRMHDQN